MRFAKHPFVIIVVTVCAVQLSGAPGGSSRSAMEQIALRPHPESWEGFEISLNEDGEKRVSASFVRSQGGEDYYDIVIRRNGKQIGRIEDVFFGRFARVGTVDLRREGREELFLEAGDGGTGAHWVDLSLICPRKVELVRMSLEFSHQATDLIPKVSIGDNFHKRSLRSEREFLVRLMYDYGYVGEADILEQAENPRFAYYFWARDNGRVQDGKMRIRRYKGKPSHGSIWDELPDGNIRYIACFKAGVVGYDEENDEHFVVFHPEDMYHWPTVLKKAGPYLVIGTRGEGLAIVNVQSFHLKRIRFDSQDDEVERLEVSDSLIKINGSREIPFPRM